MKWVDVLRTFPGGAAKPGAQVALRRHSDNADVTTVTADANGVWSYVVNGNPDGPLYATYTENVGGVDHVRVASTQASPVSGLYSLAELPMALAAMGDGIVAYKNALAVTNPSGTNLDVDTGCAVVQGIPFVNHAKATSVAVGGAGPAGTSPPSAGNTRVDLLCLRLRLPGTSDEGRYEYYRVAGTQSTGTPAVPNVPANTATDAYVKLAQWTINSASAISGIVLPAARLLATKPERRPTLTVTKAKTDGAQVTTNSTSSAAVSQLSWVAGTDIVLAPGVEYDVYVLASLGVQSTNTNTGILCRATIDCPDSNSRAYTHQGTNENTVFFFAHTDLPVNSTSLVGGGVEIRRTGNNNNVKYRDGWVAVTAVPRS